RPLLEWRVVGLTMWRESSTNVDALFVAMGEAPAELIVAHGSFPEPAWLSLQPPNTTVATSTSSVESPGSRLTKSKYPALGNRRRLPIFLSFLSAGKSQWVNFPAVSS